MTEDFFAMLDAEVQEAVQKADDLKKVERLRKASNNTRLSTEVRRAAKEEYLLLREVYEANLWITTATAALISEQSCDGCGSTHQTFLQYMNHEVYHNNPASSRWTRVNRPAQNLPRKILIQPLQTHICPDCIKDHGFGEEILLFQRASITVSPDYYQEDINAQSEEN